ncbi:MAG: 1,4-alpha-glucan branching enzyme, partial [Acidobacteriota bacterium]|nr:1,4-alpha-glucan branching enzyme [Acidobacteriota bacterium]
MAVRGKKSTTTDSSQATEAAKPPATATTKAAAPKATAAKAVKAVAKVPAKVVKAATKAPAKLAPKKAAAAPPSAPAVDVDEMQTVGADVVPRETITVDVPIAAEPVDPIPAPTVDATMFAPAEAASETHAEPPVTHIIATEPEATTPSSLLSDWDFHLFAEGTHSKLWQKLGSHIVPGGTMFAVWAPNAAAVSVMGDFNGWNRETHPLRAIGSGIWEGFVAGIGKGAHYKYYIVSQFNHYSVAKADPFAVLQETPPETASVVWDLEYQWNDSDWMSDRRARNSVEAPMSIYEVHLGSWRRVSDDNGQTWRSMTYREIARPLAEYVKKMNFTHIEMMPVMEHPFYGSWGYQCTGYFAPTSRHGTPEDFKYLVDVLHQHGIGVILDWVPSHFPTDEHGLAYFDGTHLFEHADPRKGFHPDWKSFIFNYGRNEVRSFLLSSAMYWLSEYHADGLRVDAVASMLYLDYSRKAGEWIPNEFGGRENVEAISFLRRMNEDLYKEHPDVQTIAEESTAWPMVSRPVYIGGLGFGLKWDMGWMHDSLRYFSKDPIHRRYHHNDLTFRMMYAFTESFVLPLSHDEVVHGKGSLMGKMPGDEWQRCANLRLLYAHMYANPGKKLIFMGGDLGQYREWNHDGSLEWDLLEQPMHAGINRWLED